MLGQQHTPWILIVTLQCGCISAYSVRQPTKPQHINPHERWLRFAATCNPPPRQCTGRKHSPVSGAAGSLLIKVPSFLNAALMPFKTRSMSRELHLTQQKDLRGLTTQVLRKHGWDRHLVGIGSFNKRKAIPD